MTRVDRVDPPQHADERATLRGFLECQRATFARKIEGLTPEQLRARPLATSMTLLGLVRHHADGERWLFHRFVAGREVDTLPEGADFAELDVDPDDAIADWLAACEESRAIEAGASDLDVEYGSPWDDTGTVSLRWMMVHAIEEYARHNGHADLLREQIDGTTGY